MILVLYDGSISLYSSDGAIGAGSPQYGQALPSAPTGMPHVLQTFWSMFSLFTGLGLKHMVALLLCTPVCRFAATLSPICVVFRFSHDYTNAVSFSSYDLKIKVLAEQKRIAIHAPSGPGTA